MSLTGFVEYAAPIIDIWFNKPGWIRKHRDMIAMPKTANYSTIGTAFDYLLRIKLYLAYYNKLRQLHTNDITIANNGTINYFPMVAEHSANSKKRDDFIVEFVNKLSACIGKNSKIDYFIKDCIILAKLESVYRSGLDFPDSVIFTVNDGDIYDLEQLINVVGDKLFPVKKCLYLNPTFGKSSKDIGGADGDFIIDDTLVDIKVTKELKFRRDYFRQLCGYWWLEQRNKEKYGFNKLAIYFARYGFLYTFPVSQIIDSDIKDFAFEGLENALKEYMA